MTLPVLPQIPEGRMTLFISDASGNTGRCRLMTRDSLFDVGGISGNELTIINSVRELTSGSLVRVNKYATWNFRPTLPPIPGERLAGAITMLFENAMIVQPVGNLTLASLPTRTAALVAVIELYESLFGALVGILGE